MIERTLSIAEARSFAATHFTEPIEHLLDEVDEVVLLDGDVEGASFAIDYPRPAVFVRGNVTLTGELTDWERSILCIAGNVRCRLMDLAGAFVCEGDVEAEQLVYVCSGNDYSFTVGGTVHAKVFIEHGTASWARSFECEVWSFINQVVDGSGDARRVFPHVAHGYCTRTHLRELGVDESAIEDLVLRGVVSPEPARKPP